MEIVGYSDKLTVQPGESIKFMVSCQSSKYNAQLVRLIHGDKNEKGPGFKEELIHCESNGEYKGIVQELHPGSYAIVPNDIRLNPNGSLTIHTWIYPTRIGRSVQGILTKWDDSINAGYAIYLDDSGRPTMILGHSGGIIEKVVSNVPLRDNKWYSITAVYDSKNQEILLYQKPLENWPHNNPVVISRKNVSIGKIDVNSKDLFIAAFSNTEIDKSGNVHDYFNGKIENPMIFYRALAIDEIETLRSGKFTLENEERLIASWDFGRRIDSQIIEDISTNGLHGSVLNMPTRAVTSHGWTGRDIDFKKVPSEYAAIHFHDDDLEDAGWETSFTYTVDDIVRSAIYAFKVTSDGETDYIPFVVTPQRDQIKNKIALLLGTYTFMAYSNEHLASNPVLQDYLKGAGVELEYPSNSREKYLMENQLGGLYDLHSDGSGICYASRLKPMLNVRPSNIQRTVGKGRGAPVLLTADLHQIDWLEAKGYEFDVITDEDVQREGKALLSHYNVIMSDAHPEYWTENMLDNLGSYLSSGGRFMYMGGNGFYWVTSVDPERPHIIEIRRWKGTGSWEANPGEFYHSTTGELGGLWRHRGREPQKLIGIGMTGQGGDAVNSAYRRQPDSYDPKVEFIFEGVDTGLIGDFESLGLGWGAAGYEFDRLDFSLGSPPHALLLATASDFDDNFHHVVEEVFHMDSSQTGTTNPLVRADMVFFEYPNEGAVFSTGSIAWSACLSYNNYDNSISKITDNVLKKFSEGDSFS